MNTDAKMPDDVIFWIHGSGETLVPILLEDLRSQFDRGEILPDLPVYSSSQGQWLPLKSLLIDVPTPAVLTNVQSSLFDDHGSRDNRIAKTESVRRSPVHTQQAVHPLRTSEFATRLIAMAIGVYVFGSLAAEYLLPPSKIIEVCIRIVPAVLILVVCVLCLTGPIYFATRGKDGKFRKWHVANKVVAVLLAVVALSWISRGLLNMEWGTPAAKAKIPEPFPATSASSSTVRQLAERWGQSMVDRDYATVADLTWQGTIDEAGGREAFIEAIREIVKMLEDRGIKIESIETQEPANVISEGKYFFAAVPTRGWFRNAKGRLVGESFALGISTDGGKTWTFIDGASLSTPEERDAFVPKIPAALELPPFKKAVPVAE